MFIESSSPRVLNDTARLVSAQVTMTTPKCLHFWYHMYGTHVNTLNVYTKTGSSLGAPIWHHTGTLSNKWYSADVQVQVCCIIIVEVCKIIKGSFNVGSLRVKILSWFPVLIVGRKS